VRRFAAAALDGISQEWPDPAGYGPPVSDQMTSEKRMTAAVPLRKAEVDATRAVRFENEGRQGEALALWRDILGRYFPRHEVYMTTTMTSPCGARSPSPRGFEPLSRAIDEPESKIPPDHAGCVLAAAVNSTLVAGENLTVGSTGWLPAESVAPGR
jgi:hypothetical protein